MCWGSRLERNAIKKEYESPPVCWGSRLERNAIKKEYESSPGVLGESGAAGSAVRLARVVGTREPGGPGGGVWGLRPAPTPSRPYSAPPIVSHGGTASRMS